MSMPRTPSTLPISCESEITAVVPIGTINRASSAGVKSVLSRCMCASIRPGMITSPVGRDRLARPPRVAAHAGDPAVGDHHVGRLDPAIEDVDDLPARRSAGRPAPGRARRGSGAGGLRISLHGAPVFVTFDCGDQCEPASCLGDRSNRRPSISIRSAQTGFLPDLEQFRALCAQQTALDLEWALAHLGQQLARRRAARRSRLSRRRRSSRRRRRGRSSTSGSRPDTSGTVRTSNTSRSRSGRSS